MTLMTPGALMSFRFRSRFAFDAAANVIFIPRDRVRLCEGGLRSR
jgi:hypothetical protein